MNIDLTGKVALVTGGSRGLGREMVLGLAVAGADVVIASRKLDSCRELADVVTAETGRRALPVAARMGRWDEVDRLVTTVDDAFGRIDILINNAGMAPLYPRLSAVSEELFDKVIGVAKAGLNTLTLGFAVSFGPTVRSNGIMVGPFLTDISQAWDVDAFEAHARRRYPLQRLGQPHEIVGTALYLASDAASFTTGAVLTDDGGVSVSSPFMSKDQS